MGYLRLELTSDFTLGGVEEVLKLVHSPEPLCILVSAYGIHSAEEIEHIRQSCLRVRDIPIYFLHGLEEECWAMVFRNGKVVYSPGACGIYESQYC